MSGPAVKVHMDMMSVVLLVVVMDGSTTGPCMSCMLKCVGLDYACMTMMVSVVHCSFGAAEEIACIYALLMLVKNYWEMMFAKFLSTVLLFTLQLVFDHFNPPAQVRMVQHCT